MEAQVTAGCSDAACCTTICGDDDYCCTVQWDDQCAALAATRCAGAASNDECAASVQLENGATPFSTFGATQDGPELPADCAESFGTGFGADVWFDYVANDCGQVTVSTCNQADYDTRLAVYEGCGCAVDNARLVGCNDDGAGCTDFTSSVTFEAERGTCYKVRVGGYEGATGSGTLRVTGGEGGCMSCPAGAVTFIDPPTGVVDARMPHPVDDASTLLGIDRLRVSAPAGAANVSCWSLCDGSGGGNAIAEVIDHVDGTMTLVLDRPLAPGAVTSVKYGESDSAGHFTFHPGNVDGDSSTGPLDALMIIDYLNGMTAAPFGQYSTDIDHSGLFAPQDILAVTDLLNGAGAFESWSGTERPRMETCP